MKFEHIKDPTVEDFDRMIDLLNQIFRRYSGHVDYTSVEVYERVSRSKDPMIIFCITDEEIAGFAVCYEGRMKDFYHIREIGVSENQRRKGIATRLYEQVEEFAREHGYSGVTFNSFNKFRENLVLAINRGYEIYDVDNTTIYTGDPKIKFVRRFEEP